MIVWIIASVIDSVIYFLNFIISFNWDFFNSFLDIFKKFVIWMFDTIKNFIWSYIQPFWNDYAKPIFDFFYWFFKPIWELAIGKINYQSLFWGNQDYICSKTSGFYIDVETPASLRPSELLGFFLLLSNPIPPEEQSNICTNIWVRKLDYGKSTIIDTTVFLVVPFLHSKKIKYVFIYTIFSEICCKIYCDKYWGNSIITIVLLCRFICLGLQV